MMKFAGELKSAREKGTVFNKTKRGMQLRATYIPTVDEVDEVMAPMIADTILQILRGQAYYYGYEIDREPENKIRSQSKSDINYDIYEFGKPRKLPDLPPVFKLKTKMQRRMYSVLRKAGRGELEAKQIVEALEIP